MPGQADGRVALMECGQQIPDREALLLEFPGFVKNPEAALDSFGGANAVSELLSGDRNALQLRLRPGDPLAHSLFGLKQPTKGLVLKVSRKAGQKEGNGLEGVKAEVVAHVKGAVRFRGLADFQYVSCDTRPPSSQVSQPAGPPGFEAEPLMCPPQLFSKQDVPVDYAFRSYYGSDPDRFKAGAALGRGMGRMAAHVISFQSLHVPQPVEQSGAGLHAAAGPAEEAGLNKERRQTLRSAAALFASRPVRAQQDLQAGMPALTGPEADIILPRLAYIFRNGPWKGLWVKRGYDPRSDPASAELQAIELPGRKQNGVSTQGSLSASYQDICRFAILPPEAVSLPIADIQEESIASVVRGTRRLSTCDPESGWFSRADMDQLKATLSACVERLTSADGAAHPSSATVPSRKPKKGYSNPEQNKAGSQAGRSTSTAGVAGPEAMQEAAAYDGPSDDGKSSQGPSAESRQPAEGQELQRHSNTDGEPATEAEADGQLEEQEGQLPSNCLQEVMEGWVGDAPVAGLSAEAAQAIRDAAQEDFEVYEASDEDPEMEEAAGDLSEEGEDQDSASEDEEDEMQTGADHEE